MTGAINLTSSQFAVEVDGLPMMLPSANDFEQIMSESGVGTDTHVVIVDDGNMLWASRLFWTLEYYGHDQVSILHGGQAAWLADERGVTSNTPSAPSVEYKATPNPALVVNLAEVSGRLDDSGLVLLDNRTPAEYVGEDVRTERGGHIPGAVNINWTLHLNEGDVPTIKTPEELRKMYEQVGITGDKEVVSYCQASVRGTHGYLVLRLLGYDNLRVYDAAWVEWGNREDTPIEL